MVIVSPTRDYKLSRDCQVQEGQETYFFPDCNTKTIPVPSYILELYLSQPLPQTVKVQIK